MTVNKTKKRAIDGFRVEAMEPETRFYVFRDNYELVGATVDAEDAAVLLAIPCADEGIIACRYGDSFRTLWGFEDGPATDNYSHVASVCESRLRRLFRRWA